MHAKKASTRWLAMEESLITALLSENSDYAQIPHEFRSLRHPARRQVNLTPITAATLPSAAPNQRAGHGERSWGISANPVHSRLNWSMVISTWFGVIYVPSTK